MFKKNIVCIYFCRIKKFQFQMESIKLKLNPDKTDLIIIGSKQQRNRVINHFTVKMLGSDTVPSDTVHNLGVVFDSDFNFRQHIS